MARINPHINFNGNAEEAFNFYQSVFGGAFTRIVRFKDVAGADMPLSDDEANKIMHISLSIGSNMLMANDVPGFMGRVNESENRSKIYVSAESNEEANQLFAGLSKGGIIEVPIDSASEGSVFGMLRDTFGIEWIVEYNSTM